MSLSKVEGNRQPIQRIHLKRPRNHFEGELQRSVFEWLRLVGKPGVIFYHCPNGMVSNARSVARMKAQGLMSGVADICLVRPGGAAAFLELKSVDGRQTPEQQAFQQLCQANGSPYAVARNIDEAISTLTAWGCLKASKFTGKGAAA